MKLGKNMKIGVSIIFLLLIFSTSISLIDFWTTNKDFDENSLSISAGDDLYEDNDYDWQAYDISFYQGVWLSNISGNGVLFDDDYYGIYIEFGYQHVKVNLTFLNTLGNIDLELWDEWGILHASSNSPTNDEYIDFFAPHDGYYYIKVLGNFTGNFYDLMWESYFTDDEYEENDDWFNATDISGPNHRFKIHRGIQADDDWYKVFLMPGEDWIHIEVDYNQFDGDIDFELYHYDGFTLNLIDWTFDTFIDTFVTLTGIYYIRIYGENATNEYDLRWEGSEDAYEENDDSFNAFDLTSFEGRWLSQIMGSGAQFDEDYYRIQVKSGQLRLIVFLRFFHWEGDIDIELRDVNNFTVISSTSVSDNEFIDIQLLTAGTYFLRVYYGNAGNHYDLLWEDRNHLIPDDNYEENDIGPYISPYQATWLSDVYWNNGLGIQLDEDWYEVYLDFGENWLYVELVYSNTQGNIGLEIFDTSFNPLGGSNTFEDDEYFDIQLSEGNYYYIKVYGDNQSTVYDLWWEDYSDISTTYDDSYEFNNNNLEAFDLSSYQGWWLTEVYGPGFQFDDDWFEIYVEPGNERLVLELFYDNFAGDINVEVFNSSLEFIAGSHSTNNREFIDIILPGSGWYYILVYGPNYGNHYDLMVNTIPAIGDDPYEINDQPLMLHEGHPSFLAQNEQTWLSDLEGVANQGNDDWYAIELTPGFLNLEVKLNFNHSLGDINMEIYFLDRILDASGNFHWDIVFTGVGSYSINNSEYINVTAPRGGFYLIKVFGENLGNEYDLWWDDVKSWFSDDMYEDNDVSTSAYDISFIDRHMSLWEDQGLAVQYDEDWYEFYVETGFERLIVDMKYDIAEGMLGFEIYNVDLTVITGNFSMVDDASIDFVVPSSGFYYIRVYGDNTGNVYNIRYETSEDFPIDQIPGYDTLILIVSIVGVTAVVIKKKRSKFRHQ